MAYQGEGVPTAATTTPAAPGTSAEEKKLAKQTHEEWHDPMDDWSSRDILLSLVPIIVSIAFKDTDLQVALNFGIGFWGLLLILRTVAYDSRHKIIWPMLELTGIVLFAVCRGLMRDYSYWIHKWWPVIMPLTFAFVTILTLLWRRPWTAHYARYPKVDKGGRGLWHGDNSYRRTADMSALAWVAAFSVSLLLSLIPILTGHWTTWHALNTIFDYIIPFLALLTALITHQLLGAWYRKSADKHTTTTTAAVEPVGARGYPAGATEPISQPAAGGATYSSAV